MGRFILWLIVFYVLYKFITQFLLPVINASQKMRGAMRDMQKNKEQQGTVPTDDNHAEKQAPARKGDYIDFEEIK